MLFWDGLFPLHSLLGHDVFFTIGRGKTEKIKKENFLKDASLAGS